MSHGEFTETSKPPDQGCLGCAKAENRFNYRIDISNRYIKWTYTSDISDGLMDAGRGSRALT
jgi:hypothetical protein